jgi:hypothetical protein
VPQVVHFQVVLQECRERLRGEDPRQALEEVVEVGPRLQATGLAVSMRLWSSALVSAVNATGIFHFMLDDGRVTAEVFVEFLRRAMHDAERPVILVVDGHSTHKARLLREPVEAQQGRLEPVFLPP